MTKTNFEPFSVQEIKRFIHISSKLPIALVKNSLADYLTTTTKISEQDAIELQEMLANTKFGCPSAFIALLDKKPEIQFQSYWTQKGNENMEVIILATFFLTGRKPQKLKIEHENSVIAQEFWNSVPTELLTEIFCNLSPLSLSRVSLVCKKWNLAAQQPSVRKTLCVRYALFVPKEVPLKTIAVASSIYTRMKEEWNFTRDNLVVSPQFLESSFITSPDENIKKNRDTDNTKQK